MTTTLYVTNDIESLIDLSGTMGSNDHCYFILPDYKKGIIKSVVLWYEYTKVDDFFMVGKEIYNCEGKKDVKFKLEFSQDESDFIEEGYLGLNFFDSKAVPQSIFKQDTFSMIVDNDKLVSEFIFKETKNALRGIFPKKI